MGQKIAKEKSTIIWFWEKRENIKEEGTVALKSLLTRGVYQTPGD